MTKTLVAYFSASGQTAKLARTLAQAAHADLFEIRPEKPYTNADLDWNDRSSRSSIEMADPENRPAIIGRVDDMDDYDVLFIGFPIWWYEAPRIIATFLESHDLAGKKVIPFATSGGSGMGGTDGILRSISPEATWLPGKRLSAATGIGELERWLGELGL